MQQFKLEIVVWRHIFNQFGSSRWPLDHIPIINCHLTSHKRIWSILSSVVFCASTSDRLTKPWHRLAIHHSPACRLMFCALLSTKYRHLRLRSAYTHTLTLRVNLCSITPRPDMHNAYSWCLINIFVVVKFWAAHQMRWLSNQRRSLFTIGCRIFSFGEFGGVNRLSVPFTNQFCGTTTYVFINIHEATDECSMQCINAPYKQWRKEYCANYFINHIDRSVDWSTSKLVAAFRNAKIDTNSSSVYWRTSDSIDGHGMVKRKEWMGHTSKRNGMP